MTKLHHDMTDAEYFRYAIDGPRKRRRGWIAALLAFLSLTGCAHTRYVTVPCLTPGQLEERRKAEPELVAPKLTGKADEDIRTIAGSAVELRSWGRGNLDILGGCTG